MQFRKPELVPLIFIVCAVAVLASLGVWQLQRLKWKEHEIAKISAAQQMPSLGGLPEDLSGLEYRNVVLVGTYLNDKAMHFVGHPQNQGMGFYIVTPFRIEDDGRVIVVNRGFSPENMETKPEGTQTLAGIIRPARVKRLFSPSNAVDKNVWFYEDLPAMSKATGVDLTPIIVEAVGDEQKDVYPVPHDGKISLRNDHLNYAITWFALAIIGVVMFAFYQRKPD